MAQRFQFGQNIAGGVANALRMRQQAQQLAHRIRQFEFAKQVEGVAQDMRDRKLALEKQKFDHGVLQDIINNRLEKERIDKLNKLADAQSANLQSLADSRGNEPGQSQPSQSAVNINLNSVTRQLEDKKERADQLSSAIRKIHDTGVVPDELRGDLLETTDPTQALFALTGEHVRLRSDIDRLQSQRESLNQASGISPEIAGESERQSTGRGIKELVTREDFAELRDNQMFTVPGQQGTFRKVNGQAVRVQTEDRSGLISEKNREARLTGN